MRVQLSPWEIAETTFRVPSSRRRKRASGQQSKQDTVGTLDDAFVTASFIHHNRSKYRSLKKMRKIGKVMKHDVIPDLVLTSQHKITVLGLSNSEGNSLCESSGLQFTSRPGSSTSFLPLENSTSNGEKKSLLPCIAGVYDSRNDFIYAFQRNNTRLVCWDASASKPDETPDDISASATFSHPAVNLSLKNLKASGKSILLSACQDGSVFIANCLESAADRESKSSNQIEVKYIPGTKVKDNATHVGTKAYVKSSWSESNQSMTLGSKRKLDSSKPQTINEDIVALCQVFSTNDGNVLVSKTELTIAKGDPLKPSHSKRKQTSLPLLSTFEEGGDFMSTYIDDVNVLGFIDGGDAIAITFKVLSNHSKKENRKEKPAERRQYFVSISLQSGQMIGVPTLLPPTSSGVCLVGPAILAAAIPSANTIMFYDAVRGGFIHSQLLNEIGAHADEWNLIADPERAILSILFLKDDALQVAINTVHTDIGGWKNTNLVSSSSHRISLAAGLASCFARSNHIADTIVQHQEVNVLKIDGQIQTVPSKIRAKERLAVAEGIKILEESINGCEAKITKNGSARKPLFPLEAFEEAVSIVSSGLHAEIVADHTESAELLNGSHNAHSDANITLKAEKSKQSTNGQKMIPVDLMPLAFVESSTAIVIKYLMGLKGSKVTKNEALARNDARKVLQRLIQSGRLSARNHLQYLSNKFLDRKSSTSPVSYLLRALELSEGEEGPNPFSPIEMVFCMLECCDDVSERHMITCLKYLISRAQAGDIAEFMLQRKAAYKEYSDTSERYLALIAQTHKSKEQKSDELALSRKLILCGLSALVNKIASFSDCNESLLRDALFNGFTSKEISLLLQLFVKSLHSHDIDDSSEASHRAAAARRKVQWLSALCDCQKKLSVGDTGAKEASKALAAISKEVLKTQSVILLSEVVKESIEAIEKSEDDESVTETTMPQPALGDPAPYQIERLVF